MKSSANVGCITCFFLLFLLVFTQPAYGYIDPGTGSFMIQILIGTAMGSLLAIKIFWRQIKQFMSKLFGRKRAEAKAPGRSEDQDETKEPE